MSVMLVCEHFMQYRDIYHNVCIFELLPTC